MNRKSNFKKITRFLKRKKKKKAKNLRARRKKNMVKKEINTWVNLNKQTDKILTK